MKLAFCLFNYFEFGGLQRDFLRIARACRERGHQVDVYTMRWDGPHEPQFNIQMVQTKGFSNHVRAYSFAKQMQATLSKQQYDLVIGFNKMPMLDIYYAADVCYKARAHAQRSWLYRLSPRYQQMVKLEQAVFAQGQKTQILLISTQQEKEYQQYYHTESERFHLLPPGIAKDRIAPPDADVIRKQIRQQLQLTDKDFLILMVGSGFKTKGVDRAINALAAFPKELQMHCRLFVAGEGNTKPFMKLARKLSVAGQVTFLGGRSDVPALLLAADVLLHPSYHENTGTVLLEAMLAGLPVLTLDVCGYAHYVSEAGAGMVLAAPFSQKKLNAALEEMLLSPDRFLWRKNGLELAKNLEIFSMPEKAADWIEYFGKTRATLS